MFDPNLNVARMNPNQIFQSNPPNNSSQVNAHAFASQAPAHVSVASTAVVPLNAPNAIASVAGGGFPNQGMPSATTSMSTATTSTQAAPPPMQSTTVSGPNQATGSNQIQPGQPTEVEELNK